MTSHTSATHPLDGPTIAFDRQPTVSVAAQALARDLFERSTSSTLRPVVGLTSRELPTVTTTRTHATNRSVVWLCVVFLFVGIGAGHVVRERQYYSAAVKAAAGLTTSTQARARHTTEIVTARAASLAARSKEAVAPATKAEARGARKSGRSSPASAARPSVANPVDALFIDFEPTFRAPR